MERIYERYQRDQLKETNEVVTDIVIAKSTEMLEHLSLIKSGGETGKKLQNKKLFRRDLNKLVGYFTPFLPMIGLIEGGFTVGGDILSHQMSRSEEVQEPPTEG